jgi:hypothetical protein
MAVSDAQAKTLGVRAAKQLELHHMTLSYTVRLQFRTIVPNGRCRDFWSSRKENRHKSTVVQDRVGPGLRAKCLIVARIEIIQRVSGAYILTIS